MSKPKVDILPATKVAHLLNAYPDLERVLIELSPAFQKLKNPLLRKTVAKLATLAQAAKIGKIPIQDLINTLREKAGLEPITVEVDDAIMVPDPPEWFKSGKIVKTLDGRPLLDAGEFPLKNVLDDLKSIQPGEMYEFIAPFLPAPLIEKITQKGYLCWARQEDDKETCSVFFTVK